VTDARSWVTAAVGDNSVVVRSVTDPGSLLALGAFGARLTVDSVCRTLDDVVARAVSELG